MGCTQGVPPPAGRCIRPTFAQVYNPMGTVATIMKGFKPKTSGKKPKIVFLRLLLKFGYFWVNTKVSPHPLQGAFAGFLHRFATVWAQWPP